MLPLGWISVKNTLVDYHQTQSLNGSVMVIINEDRFDYHNRMRLTIG